MIKFLGVTRNAKAHGRGGGFWWRETDGEDGGVGWVEVVVVGGEVAGGGCR